MKHSTPLFIRLAALVALLPLAAQAQESAPAAADAAKAEPAAAPVAEYSKKGADTCFACHDDAVTLAVFHGKHGQPADPRSPFGKGQLQCEACHGPAGNHTKRVKKGETRPPVIRFSRDSTTPVSVQNGMCLGCHEQSMASSWHVGAHDAANVSCASCHDSHVRKDPVLSTRTQADVCYTCHVAERGQFQKPYAHPVRQGQLGPRSTRPATSATPTSAVRSSGSTRRSPRTARAAIRRTAPRSPACSRRAARCCASPATRSRATRACLTGRPACRAAAVRRCPRWRSATA